MPEEQNTHNHTQEEKDRIKKIRMERIHSEFEEGFKFIDEYPKSVTFFGSSLLKEDDPYCISARTLAGRIAKELNYAVLTGGGPGIMEAANRGAHENGGSSLALTIRLPHPQIVNPYITRMVDPNYFFVRKVLLSFNAAAFIFFPGGYGTLDEFFEILTLVQTQKVVGVPIICVGTDFWSSLKVFIEKELLTRGTILPDNVDLFKITDNHDEILEIIKKTPIRDNLDIHEVKQVSEIS
ncbi:MAG TPA: TIGR00730 family Rossman fold protein [Parcubacteria group bacterium]|nr:TIGR00730 family Rossman fold protein [Parcubacteria group bacterium]